MQKRKRRASVWAVLLAFMCVISTMSVFKVDAKAEAATTDDGQFMYADDPDTGGYMITKYLKDEESVEIPSEINGKKVTAIGDYLFYTKNPVTVTIPDSVVTLGEGIFWQCANLKNVTLSDNIKTLPTCTFYQCTGLENIKLPSKVEAIMDGAFRQSGLKSIEIPASVKMIDKCVFLQNSNLTSDTFCQGCLRTFFAVIQNQTLDFVAHGFFARFTEMDFDAVGGLSDFLYHYRWRGFLYGQRGSGCGGAAVAGVVVHRLSFP